VFQEVSAPEVGELRGGNKAFTLDAPIVLDRARRTINNIPISTRHLIRAKELLEQTASFRFKLSKADHPVRQPNQLAPWVSETLLCFYRNTLKERISGFVSGVSK
jgi:hypothetical protein